MPRNFRWTCTNCLNFWGHRYADPPEPGYCALNPIWQRLGDPSQHFCGQHSCHFQDDGRVVLDNMNYGSRHTSWEQKEEQRKRRNKNPADENQFKLGAPNNGNL